MKDFLIRSLIGTTALLVAFFPTHISQGCIWDPAMDYPGYHLFFPEVAHAPDYKPYYFSFRQYYGEESYGWSVTDSGTTSANLDDWMSFLKKGTSRVLMDSLLYTYDLKRAVQEARKANLPAEVVSYLDYAKRCEPQVTFTYNYWEEDAPARDSVLQQSLIEEGRKAYKSASSSFLKLRYAYQVVRMAHYSGAYQTCVASYDDLVAPLRSNNLVAWWALGHKAGALAELGQRAEANYLFSKAFIHCPSKRKAMFASFNVSSEADFDAVLMQCQSAEERSAVYFMRAVDPNSRALEDMRKMYSATPGSELLNVLLAREVCKFENDLSWGVQWGWEDSAPRDTAAWEQEVKALMAFTREAYNKGNVHYPAFWKLSEAYLAYLINQPGDALDALGQLLAAKPENDIQNQALMLRFFVRLGQLQTLNIAQENRLLEEFNTLVFPNEAVKTTATREMERLFSLLYRKQDDLARAYMCQHTFDDILSVDHLPLGEAMVAWLRTPARSALDRYLRAKVAESDPLFPALEWHGTALLRHGKLTEAKTAFEALPAAFRSTYSRFSVYGEPFTLTATDCQECAQGEKATWNKLSLVTEMLKLESQGTAQAEFALGNAWYNISYFGAGWQAQDYFHSGGNYPWPSMDENPWRPSYPDFSPEDMTAYTDYEVQDMSVPLSHFRQAQAASGGDKELQAKIAFAIAKCTQKNLYLDARTHRKEHENMLKLLAKEYGKTAFVRSMMKECSYLNLYAKTGKLVELDQ